MTRGLGSVCGNLRGLNLLLRGTAMCGIAGALDLNGRRDFSEGRMLMMTGAMAHRGPNDEHIHLEPGLALGVRRLSVIDIAGGRQPIANETGDIWVAFEGELYDYPEIRQRLLARGHRVVTHCDTEAWVHLYEEEGEAVFQQALGQFGVSIWDRKHRTLLLGRDRIGISPLFYAEADGWLIWASEIKALLASGLIQARPDVCGLDYFYHFFCLPNDHTCFQGVRTLPPGHFARVLEGRMTLQRYWDLDFPDRGQERRFANDDLAAEELEHILRAAVRRRLVGEVPLSCYLSGGLDSTVILGLSSQERGQPLPAFTVGLDKSGPSDERGKAAESARMIGSKLTTINVTESDIINHFPKVIRAAEGPVLDTSSVGSLLLAAANAKAGNTVALTGEGADEALAGYVWFKWYGIQLFFYESMPRLSQHARAMILSGLIGGGSAHRPPFAWTAGIRSAQQFPWEFMAQSRERLYAAEMWQRLRGYQAPGDLPVPERFGRWHRLNQSLYLAYKVMLPGLLLSAKGDRVTRYSATEGRYPFLDERVVDFCAGLAPEYKLRGWTDKWLLRRVAAKVLPPQIAARKKTMFRANLGKAFLRGDRPAWVDQLLSPESLRATGYFNPAGVHYACEAQSRLRRASLRRFSMDMGLIGVIGTQLWHHTFCGGGLADLPTWSAPDLMTTRLHQVPKEQQPQFLPRPSSRGSQMNLSQSAISVSDS
jgi:asparagine synthase (glutamine-hydrolysing)